MSQIEKMQMQRHRKSERQKGGSIEGEIREPQTEEQHHIGGAERRQ